MQDTNDLTPQTISGPRRIAVFTGGRAEYGLLLPLLRAIQNSPSLECLLLVSGSHLSPDFGATISEIEENGVATAARIELNLDDDSPFGTAQAVGSGILEVSKSLAILGPDMLIVYGDRFETFAAAIAAFEMNIPVAHVEGGDYTEGGAQDDSVRHAITKLAHLHFTTNEQASDRVKKLGEEPWRLHTVGLPVLDLVAAGDFASPEEVSDELDLELNHPVVLFCQHSVATEPDQADSQIEPSLLALEELAGLGYQIVITYPNPDAGGRKIIDRIKSFEHMGLDRVRVRPSLGRYLFHGVLNVIGRVGRGACAGNSSGGIKETPAFSCPTVNIGSRQRGRLRGDNVIDVPYDTQGIVSAIRACAEHDRWLLRDIDCLNPYGSGDSAMRIAAVLSETSFDNRLLQKKMVY